MGLDMYLTQRIWIGGEYEQRQAKGSVDITLGEPPEHIKIPATKVSAILCRVGYWRKANQIHKWFVHNVQNGEDECREFYVSREQLAELKELCEQALTTKDASLLPTQEGFFFGNTEIDEGYWQDIEDTIKIISDLPEDGDFYYQSSW